MNTPTNSHKFEIMNTILKHEIKIPENHTAKVETIGGKVVVTFEPIIDVSRIKTGSKVMINYTDQHCSGFNNIDNSKPVDVVFFKTPHYIRGDNEFHDSGVYSMYCTFHQRGKFVFFSAYENVDYITSVVKY